MALKCKKKIVENPQNLNKKLEKKDKQCKKFVKNQKTC